MFIENVQRELRYEAFPEVTFVRCQFNLKHYSDSLFEKYDIPFPRNLIKAVPKRRAEFLAGRYCTKQAFAKLGIPHGNIAIGEHRSPVWPDGVVGSISHDNDNAIAMVKPNAVEHASVGVDIEKWVAEPEIQNLQQMIVNAEELLLLEQSGLSAQQAMTIIFSAKESFFKAVYGQIREYFGFEEATLAEFKTNQTGGQLTLLVSDYLKAKAIHQHQFQIFYYFEPGGVLTMCNI